MRRMPSSRFGAALLPSRECGQRSPANLPRQTALVPLGESPQTQCQGDRHEQAAGTLRNESRAWIEVPADDNGDAMIAAMAEAGVDYIFFTSGSEIGFYQEAVAKAHAQGRKAPKLITVTHEHAVAERGARLRRGERQARGDGGACRLRHAALRRRGAHRVPLRPARGHHRRRLADQLSRQLPGRARRRRTYLAAAELRPELHRAAVHQVGSPHGDPGQRRADDLARVAGGAHRAVRAGVSHPSARSVAAQDQGREVSDDGSARRGEARRARRRRHPRDRAAAGQGGQSVRGGGALGAQSGDRPCPRATVRADRAAGRAIGTARLPVLPAQPSALHERREPQGRRRRACARRRHSLARGFQSAAGQRLGGDDRRRAGQAPHSDDGVHRRPAAHRRCAVGDRGAHSRGAQADHAGGPAALCRARAEMRGGLRQAPHRSRRGRQVARQQGADRSEVAVVQHRQGARRQLHRVRRDHRAEPVARLPQHRAARRLFPQSGLERRLGQRRGVRREARARRTRT